MERTRSLASPPYSCSPPHGQAPFSACPAPGLAARHAECPICFEDLSSEACAVFTLNNKRTCSHIIHHQCALELPAKLCPLCRVEFGTAARVPRLESDPEGWFRLLDIEGNDRLDKEQVLQEQVQVQVLVLPEREAQGLLGRLGALVRQVHSGGEVGLPCSVHYPLGFSLLPPFANTRE